MKRFNDLVEQDQQKVITGFLQPMPFGITDDEVKHVLIRVNPCLEYQHESMTWVSSTPYQWWNVCTGIYQIIRNK